MNIESGSWLTWALLSAAFAALTAIFGKIGVQNVNSDVATFARTLVVDRRANVAVPRAVGARDRRLLGLLLSRAQDRRRVARRARR